VDWVNCLVKRPEVSLFEHDLSNRRASEFLKKESVSLNADYRTVKSQFTDLTA
jgi:hypothetical protein